VKGTHVGPGDNNCSIGGPGRTHNGASKVVVFPIVQVLMTGTQAAQKAARRRRYPVAKVKGGWTEAEDQALKT